MPLRPPKTPSPFVGYGIAVATVALATLVRWPLFPVLGTYVPFVTYFFAIAITAWFAGWRPSLLAVTLGFISAAYWLVLPEQFARPRAIIIAFAIYTSAGVLVSLLVQGLRYAKDEAESNAGELQSARDRVFELNDQLTAELAGMIRLHKVGNEVMQQSEMRPALERVIEAAIDVTHADMGNIQIMDPATGELRIVAFRGFEGPFVEFVNTSHTGEPECLASMKSNKRLIIDDVENHPMFNGNESGKEMLAAGSRALQVTALMSRTGDLVGMLSTHYKTKRRPSERDLRLIDLLAQQAANFIERTQAQNALRDSENRHRDMMEFMPAAVYRCSATGVIEYYNRRAAQLWGHEPKSGETEQELFQFVKLFRMDGSILRSDQTPMAQVLRGGYAIRNHEVILQRADGSRLVVEMNIDPQTETSGRRIGATNVFQDITEQKKNEEQQSLLASIVSSSDDAIISQSLDGLILSWNAGAERLFGYSASEMVGHSILKIVPSDRHEEVRSILDRITRGQSIEHFETVRVTKDGRILHVSLTVSAVRDQNGTVRAASKVARDITAQKRAEETLRLNEAALVEQNERLQLLSAAAGHVLGSDAPDAMVRGLFESVRDRLGVDVYFNFMVDPGGDTLRLSSYAGITEEDAAAVATLQFGQQVCGMVAMFRQPRVETYIQSSTDPVVTAVRSLGIRAYACNPLMVGGRLLGTLSFGSRSKDTFEEDELELLRTLCHYLSATYERVRLIGELRDADRLKDEFLAMLGHELRNPLAAITTGMTLLATEPPRERREWVERMVARQSNQLKRIVDDLLDVSRVSRGKLELHKEIVSLATVVEDALASTRPLIDSRRHQITIDMPAAPIRVDADPVRLAQVISNLLNNAAKYTEEGGQIRLTVWQHAFEVIVSIRDNGAGISAEMLPRVFDMFVQTDKASASALGGLGIGLTLARKMVELHAGRIEARSAGLGRGSEFTVYLPAVNIIGASDSGIVARVAEGGADRPLRILVVDDNEDAAAAITILLQQMGHTVTVAHDGPSALDRAREDHPEVVLLDIGLPGFDGFEVARRMRREPHGSSTFIIALTGFGQASHHERSQEAGIDEHLVKPVNLAHLRKLLAAKPPGAGTPAAVPVERRQSAFEA